MHVLLCELNVILVSQGHKVEVNVQVMKEN